MDTPGDRRGSTRWRAASPGVRDDPELLRTFLRRCSAGDVRAALELVDDDVVVRPLIGVLHSRPAFHGPVGVRQWLNELEAPWDSFDIIVEGVFAADGAVVAVVRLVGWRDGEPFDARLAAECRVRDGRIASLVERAIDEVAGWRFNSARRHPTVGDGREETR